jgi:hypothetical protein
MKGMMYVTMNGKLAGFIVLRWARCSETPKDSNEFHRMATAGVGKSI